MGIGTNKSTLGDLKEAVCGEKEKDEAVPKLLAPFQVFLRVLMSLSVGGCQLFLETHQALPQL